MRNATTSRPSGWRFAARTTGYFLVVAALCLAALSILGLRQISSANEENSAVRIDRAGRAAAALLDSSFDEVSITAGANGSPIDLTMTDPDLLVAGDMWDSLLDTIGGVNEGAANLFRYNPSTAAFDRVSTTFRNPAGERIGGSNVEPGLITAGHPAFATVVSGEPYVGDVPVGGRLRLAYLTPIVTPDREIAGIIAVDVGWVDDLNRLDDVAATRAAAAAIALLAVLAAFGVLVMFCSFRGLHRLTEFAHELASTHGDNPVPGELMERTDEIGYLAKGLAKVAELQRSLHERAYRDALTGVANRASLLEELARRFEAPENPDFSLLIVDLDGFKEVNDGLGHQAGDEVLTAVAQALNEQLENGEFLARLGGDEFAVLSASGTHPRAAARELADRLRGAVARSFETSAGNARLNASIGIALVPEHATSTSDALRHADLALYEVKRSGRAASKFYEPSLLRSLERRLFLTKELRSAMRCGDAITLEYQPLYAMDGSMAGLEALARWNHPTEGSISPAEFIPLAESLGLIGELGATVLDIACGQIAEWHGAFEHVPPVSVNVSAMQLADTGFAEQVRSTLRCHGVNPRQLCLEVTESVVVPAKHAPHRRVLGELVAMGISLAIDDFGTGYSSLNYLHELVVDQVKLDRSFVRSAIGNAKQARLVSGIVDLARNLDLVIVLEGIETEEQLAFGVLNDCDMLQGFFLSRPVDAAIVAAEFGQIHPALAQSPQVALPVSPTGV